MHVERLETMRWLLAPLVLIAGIKIAVAEPIGFVGRWLDSDGVTHIEIAPCGPHLCGTIAWMKEAKTDQQNPDSLLRSRPLVGKIVLWDLKGAASAGPLIGQGYNPEDGRTYAVNIELLSTSSLKIRGCALLGLMCDEETWTRVK